MSDNLGNSRQAKMKIFEEIGKFLTNLNKEMDNFIKTSKIQDTTILNNLNSLKSQINSDIEDNEIRIMLNIDESDIIDDELRSLIDAENKTL